MFIKCCNNCVCIPICKQKNENDLIHDCSIIEQTIRDSIDDIFNNGIATSHDVLVEALDISLTLERTDEYIFISPAAIHPYSTIITRIPKK